MVHFIRYQVIWRSKDGTPIDDSLSCVFSRRVCKSLKSIAIGVVINYYQNTLISIIARIQIDVLRLKEVVALCIMQSRFKRLWNRLLFSSREAINVSLRKRLDVLAYLGSGMSFLSICPAAFQTRWPARPMHTITQSHSGRSSA